MRVLIPSALRSYTKAMFVEGSGATLGELLTDLDRRYPGLRFRMVDEQDSLRPHMRVFIDGQAIHSLAHALRPGEDVNIVQALSGG
jgi:molybdopterin converting factor small subunit